MQPMRQDQKQPHTSMTDEEFPQQQKQQPIKYGDVFNVSGELASKPIAPREDAITIGEALEASASTRAGDKPVDQSDAAAIQAAEIRATGRNEIEPGGVGAAAQSAATRNAHRNLPYQQKTTLSDVLSDAREKLPADKPVTREDAEGVIGAEIRNKTDMRTTPGGVAALLASAAKFNQNK